jgi:hypothetical protein
VFDALFDAVFDRASDTATASGVLVDKLMASDIGLMLLLAMAVAIAGAFDTGALPGPNANMADLLPQNIVRLSSL